MTLLGSEANSQSTLKVQSCKLNNNKYIIASTQITKIGIFEFIAALVLKLLSRKVLIQTENTTETVKKKAINFMGKLLQGTFETRKRLFISAFSICVAVPIIF